MNVSPSDNSEYDVVIAGGGMVGVSLSIALSISNENLSILLVDNFSLKKVSIVLRYLIRFIIQVSMLDQQLYLLQVLIFLNH